MRYKGFHIYNIFLKGQGKLKENKFMLRKVFKWLVENNEG